MLSESPEVTQLLGHMVAELSEPGVAWQLALLTSKS